MQTCGFSKAIGVPCGESAPHLWGGLWMCCYHFEELMKALENMRGYVLDRAHDDFRRTYNERLHQRAAGDPPARPQIVRETKADEEPEPPKRDREPGDP